MLAELRALDPKPGLRFARGAGRGRGARRARPPRAPTAAGRSSSTPRPCRGCSSNNVYAARVRGGDAAARAFISECSASASWLVRSLEQRARTILKVATEIVERQERFFSRRGRRAPAADPARGRRAGSGCTNRPSAGSRPASTSSCDQGCFEFRFFFSSAIQAVAGGEAFSAAAVQERIRGLVAGRAGRRGRCRTTKSSRSSTARGLILRGGRLRNTVKEWASRHRWSAGA